MAAAGGVIQINFGSSFISSEAREYANTSSARAMAYQRQNNLTRDAPELRAFRAQYREDNPYPFATMDMVLDHIDRAVALGGIDSVGIGSDYDGVGDSLPTGLKGCVDLWRVNGWPARPWLQPNGYQQNHGR
jgi:membrane dipeptidase